MQRSKAAKLKRLLILSLLLGTSSGCVLSDARVSLPSQQEVVRGQLVIHSDFHLPEHHRLVDELNRQRTDISRELKLPVSNEPIHVYLFKNEEEYHQYMVDSNPRFPNRRAFFVKNDEGLNVYAYWGARVAEDLRHEVTHGYLHSNLPEIPLWLDEGIAEYFEVGRGKGGFNSPHAVHLAKLHERSQWQPDLARLESITSVKAMTQTDYAESWLWIHFLLSGDQSTQAIVQEYIAGLQIEKETPDPFLEKVEARIPEFETQLILHLEMMAQ